MSEKAPEIIHMEIVQEGAKPETYSAEMAGIRDAAARVMATPKVMMSPQASSAPPSQASSTAPPQSPTPKK